MFKIEPDKERAKSLLKQANVRLDELKKIRNYISEERVVEFYFDCIKELILALMYIEGIKTLSHLELIEYSKNYIDTEQKNVLDELRVKRNQISYYGKNISKNFFIQKEVILKEIIRKLKNAIAKNL